MKTFGSFLALFVLLLAATPALANDISLFGGLQRQGRVTLDSGTTNQLGQAIAQTFDPADFGVFGFRLSHGRVFGGEHTISYTPNFIADDRKAVFYHSNFMLQAPLPVVRPYGTVGLGSIFTMGDSVIDIGNKFAINYGAGLKVLRPVGVQFDVRGYTIPGFEREGTRIESDTLNIVEVSVGVVFSF